MHNTWKPRGATLIYYYCYYYNYYNVNLVLLSYKYEGADLAICGIGVMFT